MINAVEKIQQGIRQIVNTVEQITNQVRSYLKVTLSKGVKKCRRGREDISGEKVF